MHQKCSHIHTCFLNVYTDCWLWVRNILCSGHNISTFLRLVCLTRPVTFYVFFCFMLKVNYLAQFSYAYPGNLTIQYTTDSESWQKHAVWFVNTIPHLHEGPQTAKMHLV